MNEPRILVVDDEKFQRDIIKTILSRESGYQVQTAGNLTDAGNLLEEDDFDVVLTDLKLKNEDGLDLLKHIKESGRDCAVIIMTAHGSIASAVEAMRQGAYDYLTKPFEKEDLRLTIDRAVENGQLRAENRELHKELENRFGFASLIGKSAGMNRIYRMIEKVAAKNATVIVYGENGTGKELVARAIHFTGLRKDHSFIPINCAAIPTTLIESELFGYERGAFTGAVQRKTGLVEQAQGGTLFLDEIGDLNLDMQAKILRLLQEKEIMRVGGTGPIDIDVRIISATNKNLEERMKNSEFREDLYYRLNVVPIFLPPLRDRTDDIPMLINHFLEKYAEGTAVKISNAARKKLMEYHWPGNVRQLETTIERMMVLTENAILDVDDLPMEITRQEKPGELSPDDFTLPPEGLIFEDLERKAIAEALNRSHGSIKKAASLLGMTYKTLQYRIKKFDLDKPS
jgi:DNA-binding NtrC family response regulator